MGTVHLPKKPPTRSKKPVSGPVSGLEHDDLQKAVARIVEEETGNILQHLMGKLPPEAGDSLDTRSLKEKLSRSIDRHYREISGCLAASAVQDEAAVGTRQTSAGVAQLLRSLGGADTFDAGELEKPAGKGKAGYEYTRNDLEAHANSLLRQKTGALLSPDTANAVSIVKCRFRDNALKPKTVTDVKLAVNITEAELISPVFYGYAAAKYLIKDLICRHIIESVDRGGDKGIIDEERITALLSEIDAAHFDLSNIRGNIAQSAGLENTRTGGFNRAHNALVAILDHVKLDYQCIENTRNGREVAIREYEDGDSTHLPDERYAILLRYLDEEQLVEDRAAYDARITSFEHEVQLLWDLIEVNYHDSKPVFKVNDFEDLAKKNKGRMRDLLKHKHGAPAQEIIHEPIGVRFARMHERIKNMYEFLYPVERRLMEDRLAWLEKESSRLDFLINPHHLRPGLLIDVDVTSIKRRKTTLSSLASALGEFLRGVYACFQDAAAAVV
jgi:hypothetical protein